MCSWTMLAPLDELEIALAKIAQEPRARREELADLLSVTPVHLSDLIQGHATPSIELANALRALFRN